MQVTIFGASGKVGQQVVADALEKGYHVNAFVHSHNPLRPHANLRVTKGDISDSSAVAEALHGSSAAISALGSWHAKDKNVVSRGARTIIPLMEGQGVKRLVTLTGTAALWSGDNPNVLDRLSHALLGLLAPKILRDAEEHLRLLDASDLDWTCVRSPGMTRGNGTNYRLDVKLLPSWATIPRRAVAHCLVDQLEATNYSRSAPVIRRK